MGDPHGFPLWSAYVVYSPRSEGKSLVACRVPTWALGLSITQVAEMCVLVPGLEGFRFSTATVTLREGSPFIRIGRTRVDAGTILLCGVD